MTKEEFSKLAVSMGYANADITKRYVKEKGDDYVYTDHNFMDIYNGNFKSTPQLLHVPGMLAEGCKTTKKYDYTHI